MSTLPPPTRDFFRSIFAGFAEGLGTDPVDADRIANIIISEFGSTPVNATSAAAVARRIVDLVIFLPA